MIGFELGVMSTIIPTFFCKLEKVEIDTFIEDVFFTICIGVCVCRNEC